jgi:hypothetical protein
MSFSDVWQTLVREFVLSVTQEKVPPLGGYFADYVKQGCELAPDDYRLVALTPATLRLVVTSSNCLTDCMFELQSKFQQFVPDDWGGHMEKGRRDLGVIGFNILEGPVLDILEINKTDGYLDWAEPKLNALHWERLLIRAVVDFGRSCQAKQIRLQPALAGSLGTGATDDPTSQPRAQEELEQRYDASANALGFGYDKSLDRFVYDPCT